MVKAICIDEKIEIKTTPFILVIFGGTGDLSKRKLIPALYDLYKADKTSKNSYIIGHGRKKISKESYQNIVKTSIQKNSKNSNGSIDEFLDKFYYVGGKLDESETIKSFNQIFFTIKDLKKYQIILYLATPPIIAKNILTFIQNFKLCDNFKEKKIIMEKPFGIDAVSAIELNKEIHKIFLEKEIYRIDHYLGKETVQNILFFRFGNSIFEPLWNRSFIEQVEITVAEDIGIEHRGNFYEKSGILKDIIQNHMMQLIALVSMEAPVNFEADSIRDEKVKIFKSISNINDEYIENNMVVGQYDSGTIKGKKVIEYRAEKDVSINSQISTFFAGKFQIDNWRWAGVPFYVRAGKRMAKKRTEIVITFKNPPLKLFGSVCRKITPNQLIFSIQPEEEISLSMNMKYPGVENYPYPVDMKFNYSNLELVHLTAYERLIIDCIRGDLTLFSRQDGVEEMWKILDPIVNYFKDTKIKLPNYKAGSWGPEKSKLLLEKENRKWRL